MPTIIVRFARASSGAKNGCASSVARPRRDTLSIVRKPLNDASAYALFAGSNSRSGPSLFSTPNAATPWPRLT